MLWTEIVLGEWRKVDRLKNVIKGQFDTTESFLGRLGEKESRMTSKFLS